MVTECTVFQRRLYLEDKVTELYTSEESALSVYLSLILVHEVMD